jgi:23S rRNA (cytosine1962-C5)-methyltransferase
MNEYISTTELTEAQRLFHGRGHAYDNLSHVNVDWLPPVVLITLYQEVDSDWLQHQALWLLQNITACRSVQVQYRCRAKAPSEVLLGEDIEQTQVNELGLKYQIEFGKAQNSGLFLDMRNGRQWVLEHSAHKNVLNLFAYTCAFSVAAIAGGAEKVVNLDMSKASLSKGRDNHRLNKHNTKQIIFSGVDIFKSNGRIKKHGLYDLIICDPPSFQKGSVNIERDYAKLIRRIPQWAKPQADIMLCLNSPDLNDDFLLSNVAEHCPQCQYQGKISPPAVFKEAHQGKGLKVLLFKYIA